MDCAYSQAFLFTYSVLAASRSLREFPAMQSSNPMPPTGAPLNPDDLLTEREAAAILNVRLQTVRNWRWRGHGGPRYRKIGSRMVRYYRADLIAFIEAGNVGKAGAT